MSASLVGSEMCIRDRLEIAMRRRESASLRVHTTEEVCARAAQIPDRTCPVSYTHLTLPTICSV
eukprot:2758312-Alexandrium_andersonii.AAC.1